LILSIAQTVLIFVGVPLAVIALVAAIVFAGGDKNRAKRYRPGRPYDFAPVWFTSSAKPVGPDGGHDERAALAAARPQAALPAATTAPGVTGGASDSW
jgi:hypothetical protein